MRKMVVKAVSSTVTFAAAGLLLGALPADAQPAPKPVIVTNTPLPVTVGNTADDPVLSRDVDDPANEPFEFSVCEGSGSYAAYCPAGSESYPVPATSYTTGKPVRRLVVEFVSGDCQAAATTYVVKFSLIRTFSGGGYGHGHSFVPVNVGAPGGNSYVFSQLTRLYYNPGESVTAGVSRIGVDQRCVSTVSGYLVTN